MAQPRQQHPWPLLATRWPATLLTLIQGEASPQCLELRPPYKQLHAFVAPNLLIYKEGQEMREMFPKHSLPQRCPSPSHPYQAQRSCGWFWGNGGPRPSASSRPPGT